jgi:hypothetical protein
MSFPFHKKQKKTTAISHGGRPWPTVVWHGGWPLTPAASPSRPTARYLRSNRLIVWRLGLLPLELAAGTYRRFKRRLQGLPPFETAVGPCRQLKRRFETTFDIVWNDYLFSENHRKLNIKKFYRSAPISSRRSRTQLYHRVAGPLAGPWWPVGQLGWYTPSVPQCKHSKGSNSRNNRESKWPIYPSFYTTHQLFTHPPTHLLLSHL